MLTLKLPRVYRFHQSHGCLVGLEPAKVPGNLLALPAQRAQTTDILDQEASEVEPASLAWEAIF